MRNRETFQLPNAATRLVVQRSQVGTLHLVLALDLLHHQLGIAHHAQLGMTMFQRPRQHPEQPRIFRIVVRADAQKFRQLRQLLSIFRCHHRTIPGRPRVPAGTAIAMRGKGCVLVSHSRFAALLFSEEIS